MDDMHDELEEKEEDPIPALEEDDALLGDDELAEEDEEDEDVLGEFGFSIKKDLEEEEPEF